MKKGSAPIIEPRYRVAREFRHQGIIVSPGSKVPETLSEAERARLYQRGKLAIIRADGSSQLYAQPIAGTPTAAQLIRGNDIVVLRKLRELKNSTMTHAVLDLARAQHRSDLLLEALAFKLELPLDEGTRRVRRSA